MAPHSSTLAWKIPWMEKTLESPLDYKEIQPVHSEGDQPWDFFGRNDSMKAQHEGALPPPGIVRKDPRVPHTARRGA